MSVTTEWGLKYTTEEKPKAATLIPKNNLLEFPQQKIFNVMSDFFFFYTFTCIILEDKYNKYSWSVQ